jgi:hypothetical protein
VTILLSPSDANGPSLNGVISSRFARFSDDKIGKLTDETDAVNTEMATESATTCLQHYLLSTDQEIKFIFIFSGKSFFSNFEILGRCQEYENGYWILYN